MSRSRNIKPGFFKNDRLAECEPLARILFAGLWCEADREGRVEDRPKRLKVDCLPYDNCDCDALLDQLAKREFIVRYEIAGLRYIAIPGFAKHQNPHCKESPSAIPAPCKNSTSTVQARLIPDSLLLIPDSLILEDQEIMPPPASAKKIKAKVSRGTRLPDDWTPSDEEVQWAESQPRRVNVSMEAEKFRDYWTSKAGQGATKLNWTRTWQNWIRNAKQEFTNGNNPTGRRESAAERAARFAREGDEREAANDAAREAIRDASVLGAHGRDLRIAMD